MADIVNEIINRVCGLQITQINSGNQMSQSTESLDLVEESQYQAEIVFNKFLPYADKISDEADALLAEIKANFGKCIMLKDIKPGCAFWAQILSKYITLYGLRFTKDEHIAFIKLTYELIIIPELQPSLVELFANLLTALLKKKETISPQDLTIPWRPLYQLCKVVLSKTTKLFTLYRYPMFIEGSLEHLVSSLKLYFPPNATQEILDELRPELCPLDIKVMSRTMRLLRGFLPVQLPVEQHAMGYKLWLHELMSLWDVTHNMPDWENDQMRLISKLAMNNIGYIDWNPYIPIMFTRFVRSLNLPVRYNKTVSDSDHIISMSAIGEWIAAVLGDHSNAQIYLEKFLKTVETYFHPANFGPWLRMLETLFVKIIYYVTVRVHKERVKKQTWELPVPDNYKLTDANIDDFVTMMMPVAMTAVFNKRCSPNFCYALQNLAMMRPNLVIPNVLEKLYPTLGSDIEQHKLITAMTCLVSVSRPLVQGSRYHPNYAYPDGPMNVLPLLFSSLPGIDPNDPGKCFASLRLISTYVILIPIVDSSQSPLEMNEEERMINAETSRFEDFILQFMDKIFVLIESSSLEFVRLENQSNNVGDKSMIEGMAESALYGAFISVLLQTSDRIFATALHKLRSFVMESTFETKISGQLVAVLCRVFSRVNSQMTLKALVPYLVEKILESIGDGDDVINEENLDSQLMYLLLLLQRVVSAQGDALLPYLDDLTKVLDKVTILKSREGNQLGCQMLKNILESLCDVHAVSLDKSFNDPAHPYWLDWGESVDFDSTHVKWYVPGEQELAAVQRLFTRFFLPAVDSIQQFINKKNSLSRDELQMTLRLVSSILDGCHGVLPIPTDQPVVDKKYKSCQTLFVPTLGLNFELKMPDGSSVRKFLVQLLTPLQEILLEDIEDDTRSLLLLSMCWKYLSSNRMGRVMNFNLRRRNFYSSKKIVENKITGDKGYLPEFLLERVTIKHELRKVHAVRVLTQTTVDIMMNLFKLSISQYSRIRMSAQQILWGILNEYPSSYELLIDPVIEILQKDTELHHDAYKGALYTIVQSQANSLLVKGNWLILSKLLPALVLAKPSEKPSIIRQQDHIKMYVARLFTTTNIYVQVPESCVMAASKLWRVGKKPSLAEPTLAEIELGRADSRGIEDLNFAAYLNTQDKLLKTILENNLHWRHRQMAMQFIRSTMHPDYQLPAQTIRYFLNAMLHDSLDERKLAWTIMTYILKQLKREPVKIEIEVPNREEGLKPGRRADNEWLQYSYENRPVTVEQWDQPRYIHKLYVGYYSWPKRLEVYAPSSQQPTLDPAVRQLSDQEREVDAFFGNEANVTRLMEYLKLEERKDKDKLLNLRSQLYKYLFANHGDAHLDHFLPHLQSMVQNKQESVQRCASEIITGLVRGAKHWPFHMSQKLWSELLPILRVALANLTEETIPSWSACFYLMHQNRDPNRQHWLIECLVEESQLAKSEASLVETARLMLLEKALHKHSWKLSELMNRLMPQIEARLLENPFDNVRDQLALVLVTIFNVNLKFRSKTEDPQNDYPEIDDFIDKFCPLVQVLLREEDSKSSTYIEAARLLTTVCTVLIDSVAETNFGVVPSFFKLFPVISQLESSSSKDTEELARTCTHTLAMLAVSSLLPEHLPAAMDALEKASRSSSWSVRANCAHFLQSLLFHNMSTIMNDERLICSARSIVLDLVKDEHVQVRDRAAQVLNGMLHCTLILDEQALLDDFKRMAKTKFRSKKSESANPDAIRLRHAGVLGMCAFVQAHPYDIPKDIPPIFEHLSIHLSDPEPIPTTIRKTFNDFKRTHCDGWTGLQGLAQELTEEQFALLQDITVPPSYYA